MVDACNYGCFVGITGGKITQTSYNTATAATTNGVAMASKSSMTTLRAPSTNYSALTRYAASEAPTLHELPGY